MLNEYELRFFLEENGSIPTRFIPNIPILYVMHDDAVKETQKSDGVSINLVRINNPRAKLYDLICSETERKFMLDTDGVLDYFRVEEPGKIITVELADRRRGKNYGVDEFNFYTTIDHIVVPSN